MGKYDIYKSYKKALDDEIEMMMMRKSTDYNSIESISKLMKLSHKLKECLDHWDSEPNMEQQDEMISMDFMNPNQMEYMANGKVDEYTEYMNYKNKYNQTGSKEDKMMMLQHLENLIGYYDSEFKKVREKGFCMEEVSMIRKFLQRTYGMTD